MPIPPGRTPHARWTSLALVAITLGAALWRLPTLAIEDLWFDEVFTAVLAAQDAGELLRRAIGDQTNPPGFYFLLWGWTRLGSHDPVWLRTLPALAALATIPAIAWSARALGMGAGASLLAALLAATAPLIVAMGSEVRAYAVLALAATLHLGVSARIALDPAPPSPAARFSLAALGLLLASLHYFGSLVIAASLVATAWTARGRLRLAAASALPAGVLLSLWIVTVLVAAAGGELAVNARWIPPVGGGALTTFAANVVGGFSSQWGPAILLLALVAALAMAARHARDPSHPARAQRARWLVAAALVPLVVVPVLGLASGQPIWVARYLIIVLPPLWLLLAEAACSVPPRPRVVTVATLAAWAAFAGPVAELARPRKTPWSLVVRALAGSAPVRVCVNEPFVGLPLEYYAIAERLPLEVQPLERCVAMRDATLLIGRPETGSSLEVLRRAGAELGAARPLGTQRPEVVAWPIARWATR